MLGAPSSTLFRLRRAPALYEEKEHEHKNKGNENRKKKSEFAAAKALSRDSTHVSRALHKLALQDLIPFCILISTDLTLKSTRIEEQGEARKKKMSLSVAFSHHRACRIGPLSPMQVLNIKGFIIINSPVESPTPSSENALGRSGSTKVKRIGSVLSWGILAETHMEQAKSHTINHKKSTP